MEEEEAYQGKGEGGKKSPSETFIKCARKGRMKENKTEFIVLLIILWMAQGDAGNCTQEELD